MSESSDWLILVAGAAILCFVLWIVTRLDPP